MSGTEGLEKLSPRQSTHGLGARPRFICPTLQSRIQKCMGLCWVCFLRDLRGGSRSENVDFPPFWGQGGGAQEAEPCSTAGGGCALSPLRDLGSGLGLFRAARDCWGTSGGLLTEIRKSPQQLEIQLPIL